MNSDKEDIVAAIEHAKEKGQENSPCGEEHRQLSSWLTELQSLRLEKAVRNSAADEAFNAIAILCGCSHWEYPGQLVRDVASLAKSWKDSEDRNAELKLAIDDLYDAVIHEVPEEIRNEPLKQALEYIETVEESNPVLDSLKARLLASEEKSEFYMKDWYDEKHKFGARLKEESQKRKEAERLFDEMGDIMIAIAEALGRMGDCFSTFPQAVQELMEENERLKSDLHGTHAHSEGL